MTSRRVLSAVLVGGDATKGPVSNSTLVAAISFELPYGRVVGAGNRPAEVLGLVVQRRLPPAKVAVDQIAHHRCLRAARRLCLVLQPPNVAAIELQRDRFRPANGITDVADDQYHTRVQRRSSDLSTRFASCSSVAKDPSANKCAESGRRGARPARRKE